ncbi:probable disease resistance protein At4g27220 [Prosopis cineraria]|uniref:probable disease resistance protein At4g27220 n=1 Tax=Prosopis cineraria TaxID=364024 RepID=UPI00240F625C|nr:probable disease resistance protein At4g27220 [Prosopis cineraria]XP_054776453.1 probable disease resistance protein At4g27220 [Prosopis cineraria]
MAEGLIGPALGPVVKLGVEEPYKSISGRVALSKNLEDIYDLLNQYLQRLLAIKEDKEIQVQWHKQQDTTVVYRSWRKRVSNIVAEVDNMRAEYERKRLPKWRFIRRSGLCEKIAKRHNQVKELLEEGLSMNILVDYKQPEAVLKVLDAPQITSYPTLQRALEEILDCLGNKKMKGIGIYGMMGVGKTTIMQNLNNSEEVSQMFDMVIFITLSGDQNDIKHNKLQQLIASRLKIGIEAINESIDEVARRIHEELCELKFLLILDGVVDFINLQQLGIPNDENGSKIVMASQFLHVCNANNMDRLIEVERLQHDEAWNMFRDVAGPVIERPGIIRTARRVCNRCSRLPLLIHKIARSFKLKNDAPSWRAALEDLDEQWREHQNEGLEELYSFLEFCYGQLKDKQQKCFLYTSLYPADSKVYTDYLVECWTAQGFLGDVNEIRRYQKARDSGHMVIGDLINLSLLEKGERMLYVTMNGCMRQLASHILSRHPQYNSYVYNNEESEDPPSLHNWGNAKWVSMVDTKLYILPPSKDSNMLETLLLQKNSKLSAIPVAFFENMSNLLVLDLQGTAITKLPSSLSNLNRLRGFYLNSCKHLSDLPPEIAFLQFLEVLDIRGSRVNFISSYIGSLINLRCLRIPFIKNGEQIDHREFKGENYHKISKLQNIEELIIEVISYDQWCNQAQHVMEQVSLLKKLTTLGCSFPSSKILTSFMASWGHLREHKQLISFQFFIGCQNSQYPQILQYFEHGLPKYMKYCNGGKDDEAMEELISETDAFELICHKDITSLSDLGIKNLNYIRGFLIEECNSLSTIVEGETNDIRNGTIFPNLEQLHMRNLPNLEYVLKGPLPPEIFCKLHTLKLENCSQLESIFDKGEIMRMNGMGNVSILPNLEKLFLKNIPKLKCVFKGPLHLRTFSKLQILALENCSSLDSLFSNGVIQNFAELRKLEIRSCSKIEELILTSEDVEKSEDVLPSLKSIELVELPNLQFICKKQMSTWPSLETLKVQECHNLKSLPFNKSKAARLRSIKGNQHWWNELGKANKEVHQQFVDIFVAVDS